MTTQGRSITIEEISLDPRNANRGTQRGSWMLEQSLRRTGAGRSIVVDKGGVVIAGNKTLEKAVELGMPLVEVEIDGTELVVVKRRDLDLSEATGIARELAYLDNRSAEVSLDWDPLVLQADLDAGVSLDLYWYESELADLLASDDVALSDEEAEALPEDARIRMCLELDAATFEEWTRLRERAIADGFCTDEQDFVEGLLSAWSPSVQT